MSLQVPLLTNTTVGQQKVLLLLLHFIVLQMGEKTLYQNLAHGHKDNSKWRFWWIMPFTTNEIKTWHYMTLQLHNTLEFYRSRVIRNIAMIGYRFLTNVKSCDLRYFPWHHRPAACSTHRLWPYRMKQSTVFQVASIPLHLNMFLCAGQHRSCINNNGWW